MGSLGLKSVTGGISPQTPKIDLTTPGSLMKWRANITLAFVTIMMLVPLQAWASTYSVVSRNLGEPAIAFRVDDMRSGRLPARIHERRIPPVFSSQIVLACLGIAAQPEDILVYLPQSRRCMAFEDLPNRVRQTSAHSAQTVLSGGIATQSMAQPEGGNTVILMPAAFSSPAGACICPAPINNPPVASVLAGSPQQALAAATINQITFQATDAENLSISHSFSYTLDGGLSMNGLPAGLSAVLYARQRHTDLPG